MKYIWLLSSGILLLFLTAGSGSAMRKTSPAAVSGVSFSIVETGFAVTPEAFVMKGGSLTRKRRLAHVAIVVKHPRGIIIFDTGLGSQIKGQFSEHFNAVQRSMFKFTQLTTLREVLDQSQTIRPDSIKYIIPSHLHFDHASGIEDFAGVNLLTTRAEYESAMSSAAHPPAFIRQQYDSDSLRWNFFTFDSVPFMGFAQSYDVFGDSSVVLVPLPGHTEGSLGLMLRLESGRRFFFSGDLTWVREALEQPAEKFFVARKKVDGNRSKVWSTILQVHEFMLKYPGVIVVPAHDSNAQQSLAHFPGFEK